ncbi:MAG: 50S ribosomal protein L11 methyltransferase [Rhodothermales bacterium]|nr:50S ribosomal protein L11 methyltransferase [Rhodothermales bacterium]
MKTLELTVHLPDRYHEFLIAELSDLDFDAFEEGDGRITAYAPAERWGDVRREHVERWLRQHDLPAQIEERIVPDENWNARWEQSIAPLAVGPFLVRPTWAETPPEHAGKTLLEIDPKMSFGTGYHESTRLALRFLPGLVRGGERVLDAGCGTGILAIAALKLGAAQAHGFDIDPWARQNAEENALLNGVGDRFEIREGSLEVAPDGPFDLVLANINRNALLTLLPGFAARLAPGGRLVLAGLLQTDRDRMLEATRAAGLAVYDEAAEGEWWSAVLFPVSD